MHKILEIVSHFGYLGIFFLLVLGIVGLPIPDETVLASAGYLIYKNHLKMAPTLLAACLGSLAGITVSYALGRFFGLFFLHRYGAYIHVTQERIDRARAWLRRVGKWGLTFGYFIPGIRHLTAYFAGASELEWPVFAAYAYTGGVLWSLCFIWLGYRFGEGWETQGERFRRPLVIAALLLSAAGLVYYFVRRRKRVSHG